MKIHARNTQQLCENFLDECNALGKKEKDQREDCRLQSDRRDMLYCDAESNNQNHRLILFSEVDSENMKAAGRFDLFWPLGELCNSKRKQVIKTKKRIKEVVADYFFDNARKGVWH